MELQAKTETFTAQNSVAKSVKTVYNSNVDNSLFTAGLSGLQILLISIKEKMRIYLKGVSLWQNICF